jgi:hypothetical protein
MSIRTTETKVTFHRPFTLAALDGSQPAGTYRLVVEEEQIPGLSFVASDGWPPCSMCRPIPCPAAPAKSSPSCRVSLPRPWQPTLPDAQPRPGAKV